MKLVNSINVSPQTITLAVGSWFCSATATILPSDVDCNEIVWHSDNPTVASVNESTGYIYGNTAGTTKVYASATDGSGCSDYLTVTVCNTIPVTSVTLSHSTISLEAGNSTYLYANICPENASIKKVNWTTSDSSIATVQDGTVVAHTKGTATITATATDGSGCCSCCIVNVTENTLVTSITISPPNKALEVNSSCYLTETVFPSNALNKSVSWSSSDTDVATVNSSGMVYAKSNGSATVYATAQDGSGVYATCRITVYSIRVNSIQIISRQSILSVGETTTLYPSICPDNASDKSVVWTSSNTTVATVGKNTGIVTGKSKGTTTITAKTVDGNKIDSCTIKVDPREKVTIKKENYSIYAQFENNKRWYYIGIDLSKREENYNHNINIPNFDRQFYNELIVEEQRYLDNIEYTFSEKEIGFLYLIDPKGIEYYMRKHACDGMSSTDKLFFKDRVYKEIFGVNPRLIKIFPDNIIKYYRYQTEGRDNFYSDAEIMFGEHLIVDPVSVVSFLLDVVPSVSLSLFSRFYPPVGVILDTIDLVKFLFFSGSATNILSSGSSTLMQDFTTDVYTVKYGETIGERANKAMGWVTTLLSSFSTILDATQVFTPSTHDVITYRHANSLSYNVKYRVNGSELSMEEIISRITSE